MGLFQKASVVSIATLFFLIPVSESMAQDCSYEYAQDSEQACCAICKEIAKEETKDQLTDPELRSAVNCIDHVYFKNASNVKKIEALSVAADLEASNWTYEVPGGFSPAFDKKVEALFSGMFGQNGLDAALFLSKHSHAHLICRALYVDAKGACETVLGEDSEACK